MAQSIRAARAREGVDYRDVAVFYRTNAQSRVLEEALRRAQRPVPDRRRRALLRARARSRTSSRTCACVVNPLDDVALRRVVNAPPRGIGKATLERLAEARARPGHRCSRRAARFRASRHQAAARRSKVRGLIARLGTPRGRSWPLPAFIDEVVVGVRLPRRAPGRARPRREARLENLKELGSAAEEFVTSQARSRRDDVKLETFLEHVALVADTDEFDRRPGA